MSVALILVIVIGGTLLMAGALVWFLVWNGRSYKRDQEQAMARLQQEIERRGWRYEERNDAYCAYFDEGDRYIERNAVEQVMNPLGPYLNRREIYEARQIVTGTHRGRPFLAGIFRARTSMQGETNTLRVIWVRGPGTGPALQISRVAELSSRVNAHLGQGDVQTGDPEFDLRYEVRSGNADFARAVLSPSVTAFLKSDPRTFRGFALVGGKLDFFDQVSDHRDPKFLLPALDLRCDLLDRIPHSVWH
ncbi:hypothetical protein [Amycolatopsis orientalis]|uniref:hypothetical protein n=1 Tax=Amycolatopsis orientalis TaxID=31958 RepID=UPI00039F032A|nr:hypothetical protein [Amycolatopsis orientalis]